MYVSFRAISIVNLQGKNLPFQRNLKPGIWNLKLHYTQLSSKISPLMLTMISFTGTFREA